MRKSILMAGLAALIATAPGAALAKDKGKSGHGYKAGKGHASGYRDVRRDVYRDRDGQRSYHDRHYAGRACPPGLAKKSPRCVPPGIAKKRWNTGDRFPATYRTNNIPSQYRDRYQDSDRSLYRYDDGDVYRIDPSTRRILEVINPILR